MARICIPPDSRRRLLALARNTLETFVLGGMNGAASMDDPHLLTKSYGVFVSLHKGDELRGCIGTCFPVFPLYQEVIEMTEAAAARDSRVAPVLADELGAVVIEISVLSSLRVLGDPRGLEIGTHGLHVCSEEKKGVLLPRVATDYGWDREMFLAQACVKAGLASNAWKWPETQVSSFSALVLREEK